MYRYHIIGCPPVIAEPNYRRAVKLEWRHVEDSHAAVKLGKLLFPLFALALDLPETFFDDKVN